MRLFYRRCLRYAWTCKPWTKFALALLILSAVSGLAGSSGGPFISEILFNPPGVDSPNEYIELRGVPNSTLPSGTYLIGVEGDAANNPGMIQDVFDLSGRQFGGNGFLVLLQKTNVYRCDPLARVYTQTGPDPGWGHGAGSTLKHRGEGGQTDLENGSCTFFLIQSPDGPAIGDDIDVNNDGVPDSKQFARWTIFDSVGILDSDGAGDIAYGRINFRRPGPPGNAALASGTVVPTSFTPSYVARIGNSTGWLAGDWIASDIPTTQTAPGFTLSDITRTSPSSFAGFPLNHIGGPNFGADAIPGIAVLPWTDSLPMPESGATNQYALTITTAPIAPVAVEITAGSGLEVSTDQGASFGSVRTIFFARAETRTLSEVLANPVGGDLDREFIEIRGQPGALLRDVWLLALETEASANPGVALLRVDLDGVRVGANGLILLASPGHPYEIDPRTTFIPVDDFTQPDGALPNASISLTLVTATSTPHDNEDLDNGDNGTLEELHNVTMLDSVSWLDGHAGDISYGGLLITDVDAHPDAATRFLGNNKPNDPAAWFYGDMKTADGSDLRYDRSLSSANTPPGAVLTPGTINNSPPLLGRLDPMSGAIGDPTNPDVLLRIRDLETPSASLVVEATSTNQDVIRDVDLTPVYVGGDAWRLHLEPVGVGYSLITIRVSDGRLESTTSFRYAASAAGFASTRYLLSAGDGSTGIPLPGNRVVIGDDENEVLRVYDRSLSGLPLQRFNMTPALGLTDIENGIPREVDIEGSTRVGDRLFWIGSHSNSEIGDLRPNRSRIFATDLSLQADGIDLAYAGRYDHLKEDLVAWDTSNGHGKGANYYGLAQSAAQGVDPKARDGSGFNIEGLAMAPGSVEIGYIGLRAPLAPAARRTHALIVPVLNFTALAVSGGPPGSSKIGNPIEMDLFGRGFRSIEGVGNHYLIVAGPPGPASGRYPSDFRLYTWTGDPQDAPELRTAALDGLNPEGIVELPTPPWNPSTPFQLISDNGTKLWYGDDVITKLLPEVNFKKCQIDWVSLGAVTKPQPILLKFDVKKDRTELLWRALTGESYHV
ncbi:MAG: hypothetical protein HYR88_01605, partial [Verrucomicrobia bacterium]|nr:hypothetical protein [Verrucomicrobiota bacterium]